MTKTPFYAYIHRLHHRTQGSAYKYYKLMQSHFGGLIAGRIEHLPAKPDLAFVRGDTCEDYMHLLEHDIPYIVIENDCMSMRMGTKPNELEIDRIMGSKGMIFTTQSVAQHYLQYLELPLWTVIPLRPLRSDLIWSIPAKLPIGKHLVYAGNITPWKSRSAIYGYKSLHDVFRRFIAEGWTMHVYVSSIKNAPIVEDELRELGCVVHDWLPYRKLLQEMHKYTAGLHAFNNTDITKEAIVYGHAALPNKVWDYLAAGIPTVSYNVGAEARSIYQNTWAITLMDDEPWTPAWIETRISTDLPLIFRHEPLLSPYRLYNVMDRDLTLIEDFLNAAQGRAYGIL